MRGVGRQWVRPLRTWSRTFVPGLAFLALIVACGTSPGFEPTIRPSTTTTRVAPEQPSTISTSSTTDVPGPEMATVTSVSDGDTIRVVLADGSSATVLLIGIDAPEPTESFGADAMALLASLVEGQEVYLVPDESDRDQFDRLLRYVYVGEKFINEAMVGSGLALATAFAPNTTHADDLAAAEASAAEAGRGSWGATTTVVSTTTTTLAPTTATTTAPTTTTAAPTTTTAPPVANCHSSYQGACLKVGQGDYDCAGGSGNGPNYVSGPIAVVGWDEFDLDRDNDGIGCE